jgi:hypothetical protein
VVDDLCAGHCIALALALNQGHPAIIQAVRIDNDPVVVMVQGSGRRIGQKNKGTRVDPRDPRLEIVIESVIVQPFRVGGAQRA